MTRPYFELDQDQFIATQSNDSALQRRITDLEAALRYIRDELTRHHFTTGFDHLLDRIDEALPSQLTNDITDWCAVYDKRVVMVSVNGDVKIDPEFAKEQS